MGNIEKPYISVVSPIYLGSNIIAELYERLVITLQKISPDFEIILVNDASPDNSWAVINELCKNDSRLKAINFSRNFGQHHAISAGLDCCSGEWVVVMDCDLQDAPEEITRLYKHAIDNNFDVVFAERINRQDGFLKKFFSKIFYSIFNYFTGTYNDGKIANFSIVSEKVVLAFRQLKEKNRDYTFFINWLGFSRGTIKVEHNKRNSGNSSYDLRKLIHLGFNNIIANTNKPLYISIKLGFLISFLSFMTGLFLILLRIFDAYPVEGWTSIIVSIWLVCGLLMIVIGTTGIYIGKIFDETKSRPTYIIENKINF